MGTRHAFFSITFVSIYVVSWGGQSSVTRSGFPGPKNPKSSATKTTTWHCSTLATYPLKSAQGFFGFIFRRCPPSREYFFQFFVLGAKAAFAGRPRFGSVTVWGWKGSIGSGFRFRRFLYKKSFSVFQYIFKGKDGSGFGSCKTVPAVPVSVSGKTLSFRSLVFWISLVNF